MKRSDSEANLNGDNATATATQDSDRSYLDYGDDIWILILRLVGPRLCVLLTCKFFYHLGMTYVNGFRPWANGGTGFDIWFFMTSGFKLIQVAGKEVMHLI